MRVLAALSGGVDSSVAAARMLDEGHDVVGVHLALAAAGARGGRQAGSRGCCSRQDAHDARRVADRLGIAFYVWDVAQRFAREVVEDFVAEYARGRTPNPCVRCNERIKFAAVLDRALALGFDAVCTGHYARRDDVASTLHRAVDTGKDQSYVLAVLTPAQLSRSRFPLGGDTKQQVRAEALSRGLGTADKPDSHDVCFIPDGDTAGFLRRRIGSRPGPVVDAATGQQVGVHDGAHAFTVGQRRGLRLSRPAPDGQPRYVLSVEPATSTVTVGESRALEVGSLSTQPPVWCGPTPPSTFRALAQYRAHGEPVGCAVRVDEASTTVVFDEPQRGLAPGQTIAWYDGDRVVGSATIAATAAAR